MMEFYHYIAVCKISWLFVEKAGWGLKTGGMGAGWQKEDLEKYLRERQAFLEQELHWSCFPSHPAIACTVEDAIV